MNAGLAASRLAYIALGSNLEDPAAQIRRAVWYLERLPDSDVLEVSSLYRSAPFGPVEQPDFINAVASLETQFDASELLQALQATEIAMGRVRGTERWGPRVIDLDLLVFGDQQIDTDTLVVPHPGIAERNFVLLPLREIAPDLIIPGLGPVKDIAVDESTPQIERIA